MYKRYRHLLTLVLFVLVLVFMALISPVSGENVISYGLLPLLCVFYGKKEYLISFFVFSVLVFCCIPPAIPLSPFILVLYIVSVITTERLLRLRSIRFRPWDFVLLVSCIFFLYLSCRYSFSHSYGKLPIFALVVMMIYYANIDRGINLLLLNRLLRIVAIVGIIYVFLKLTLFPVVTEEGRRGLSIVQNVNSLGRGLAILVLIFLNDLFLTRKKIDYVYIVLCLISIFLTGSRTSLLATLASILCILYIYSTRKLLIVKYTVCVTFIIAVVFIILNSLNFAGVARYLDIFSLEKILANTRFYTWAILFTEVIPENWLWGIGLGNINSEMILEYVPDGDNMYVDVLTQLGVVGLIMLLSLIISRFVRLNRFRLMHEHLGVYLFIPLGLLFQEFFFSFTESVFDEMTFWFTISLTFIYINALERYGKRSVGIYRCS